MRWIALVLLCLGDLMIVLDVTIVNVALPSIRTDLGFTATSLVWVVNAYLLTFSGFLLLGGRLGDLFGHRRIFLIGLSLFTLASLACGIAESQLTLIAARTIQGLGGAIVSAVALSLIITLFQDPDERAKAMGYFGFIAAGGGAIGVLLGGILTGTFDWHWIFLVNVPVGIIVFVLCMFFLPHSRLESAPKHLDLGGAITITLSLMLAVYAIVGGNVNGWVSMQTLGLLAASVLIFCIFIVLEGRVKGPLVPLSIFKNRSVTVVSIIGVLWSAGMFASFFLSALYLQLVLHYTPLQVGLSFLPANLIMAAFSLGLSARIVMRFGTRKPLALGMALITAALLLFAIAPADANFILSVLPPMILLGVGAGMAFNPVLLAGTSDVSQDQAGLASGVLNTAFMMGGSLGLAILASLAASRTSSLVQSGSDQTLAILSGYHAAFFVGAMFTAASVVIGLVYLKNTRG